MVFYKGAKFFLNVSMIILTVIIIFFTPVLSADEWATATIDAGGRPDDISVNPVTNKIYVANYSDTVVTVIDGVTNSTKNIYSGDNPNALAINTNTNRIYICHNSIDIVFVVDGESDAIIDWVTVGDNPRDVCVNPKTNKIYVTNYNSNNVTVIDGASHKKNTISVGAQPASICVNPNTNKIYVANTSSDNVTVIDGNDNSTATVNAGDYPRAICVNPNNNKIYVANFNSDSVTIIDGEDNSTATIEVGDGPRAICVNPNANKIYVANYNSSNVTVINGIDNSTTNYPVGSNPNSICVNPNTDNAYVSNSMSDNVSVVTGNTVPAGDSPRAICVNPNTNRIYVANYFSDNVTVIDGVQESSNYISGIDGAIDACVNIHTNTIYVANSGSDSVTIINGVDDSYTKVAAGNGPRAICVNQNTNKIYCANYYTDDVTVIDGETNIATTFNAGNGPIDICVNSNTNKIYVANSVADSVAIIDGVDNSKSRVAAGDSPNSIYVNPNTNKIYVANQTSDNVTVIDGATNSTTTVGTGDRPYDICGNPNTNKIYVANYNSNNVTVIDGFNNSTTTVAVGTTPRVIFLNPNTNKIYTVNNGSNNVTVIDGEDNSTTTVPVGSGPFNGCINLNKNKIYVTNYTDGDVSIIDGVSNNTTLLQDAGLYDPRQICYNPHTKKLYVMNTTMNSVCIFTEIQEDYSPLTSSVNPLTGNIATSSLPILTGKSVNSRYPANCDVMKVLYQMDETQGEWKEATITSGVGTPGVSWEAIPDEPLTTGYHSLYVNALDMTSGTINKTENFAGSITPYHFFVASSYADIVEYNLSNSFTPDDPWTVNGSVSLTFNVQNTTEKVLENISFSSSDLTSGNNFIQGNDISFSPSMISELQPGYTEEVTATVPVSIGQGSGTYTGKFCALPGRSSPDYVNVSVDVNELRDIDVQDYGADLSANTMTLCGVENSVVVGSFNLSSPNTKDDNYDPYDGPGNATISNLEYLPDTLFTYGNGDSLFPSDITIVDTVSSLTSGNAYQCIIQASIEPGLIPHTDFVGDFTVQSGTVSDKFTLVVRVVEPGGTSGLARGFGGEAKTEGNHLYWDDFKLNEMGYNLYRSNNTGGEFTKLNSSEMSEHEYLDEDVSIGQEYLYKLGIKRAEDKELLLGPIKINTIGGSELPEFSWLAPCEPNPFRGKTQIRYQVTRENDSNRQKVNLNIYNISGRTVRTLIDEECLPGYYTVNWNGRDDNNRQLPSGIYFYRLKVGGFSSVRKLVLIK